MFVPAVPAGPAADGQLGGNGSRPGERHHVLRHGGDKHHPKVCTDAYFSSLSLSRFLLCFHAFTVRGVVVVQRTVASLSLVTCQFFSFFLLRVRCCRQQTMFRAYVSSSATAAMDHCFFCSFIARCNLVSCSDCYIIAQDPGSQSGTPPYPNLLRFPLFFI